MKKVLVCDDDEGIVEVITIILQEDGYEVETLNSGDEAVSVAKKFKPDLILLDLWMPGTDGKEASEMLREDKETQNIPIILFSALNDTEKIASEIKVDDFMPKPFEMDELLKKVHQYT